MPGPSRKVQGGYLGYSALTDSYFDTIAKFQGQRNQRLEQEKLELQNEQAVDDMFTLPEYQQSSAAGSKGKPQPKTTVVTNGGFSFTANPNDAVQTDMLTPSLGLAKTPEEQAYDSYKQDVVAKQRDVFKGKNFTLDGSALPQGGTFNSVLQGALEGLKGEYIREGRRTSPRRRREGRSRVRQQLQALQGFANEVQGAQQAYVDAYNNDLISYGTGSEFIDFLNTLQVPNDLQVSFKDGRGALVGTSASGMPINLPLDNIETIKNGLVLKGNNPQPLINALIKDTNKVTQSVGEDGVKTENNAWTVDKTNMVENQLSQLLKSDQDVLSMGVDWLGYDPSKFKSMVQENPQEARQNVLDALAYHVRSQHQPIDKGGLTADQAIDNKLAQEKFAEQKRATAVREGQAQQRIDKPTGGSKKTGLSPEEQTKELRKITDAVNNIEVPKGEEGFFGTKKPKDRYLNKLVGGNVKSAKFSAGTSETKDQFPDGYFEVELKGGGKNFIDVNDRELLIGYIAEAQGIDSTLVSNTNQTKLNKAEALRKKYKY